MSYMALYRKWRPDNFDDVIGQEHVVKTMKNQIKLGRIAHAYLLCGTRGTGKTSIAKIFAKAVNCQNPIDGNPCNECEVCKLITNKQSMNVVEIDAASNNGVDNIREINEEVKYKPTSGKYKVYIIDEVHMLSTGAFNALLKTLEEPPPHVIFVLATTEPHKILATILSRCQRYDLKRISIDNICQTLTYYMEQEKIDVQEKALRYIAKLADGSMRDGLSILDQCISFYIDQQITLENVLDVLGAVDQDVFYQITKAIYNKDTMECLNIIDKIVVNGRDLSQFILDLINHMRNIVIIQVTDEKDILDMSSENIEKLKEQGKNIQPEIIMKYIKELSLLENQIKYSSQKRILIEVQLIKLCQPKTDYNNSYESLVERINEVEKKIKDGVNVVYSGKEEKTKEEKKTKKPVATRRAAIPEEIEALVKKWDSIRERIKSTSISNYGLFEEIEAGYLEGNVLYLVCPSDVIAKTIGKEERVNFLITMLQELEKKTYNIKVIEKKEFYTLKNDISYDEENKQDDEEDINNIIKNINFNNIEIE